MLTESPRTYGRTIETSHRRPNFLHEVQDIVQPSRSTPQQLRVQAEQNDIVKKLP